MRGRAPLSAIQKEFRGLGPVRAERATEIVTRVLKTRCLATVDKSLSVVANEIDRDLQRAFEDALRARDQLDPRKLALARMHSVRASVLRRPKAT